MLHLLAQLSDLHICAPGRRLYPRVDTAALLQDAVAAVQRLPVPPLGVLLSGDLVDDGSPAAYSHLRELLAPLTGPLWPLPGNHDERHALRQAFADQPALQQTASEDFIQYEVPLPGLRLLVLDTLVPGASHGALCPRRLAWLAAALARDTTTPVVLALHHPPFDIHVPGMDRIGLRDGRPELAALVAQHPQVQRVVCGHVHRSVQRVWAGTLVQSAPSTAHQIALALGLGPAPAPGDGWTLEPPSFLVHAWRQPAAPGEALVTHQVFTSAAPGPFGWGG